MKRLLLILFASFALKSFGQYSISSINITLPAQPPANTNAWANGLPPFMIMAQAKLVNGQVPGNVIESRILVTIKSGGAKVCGAYMNNNAPRSNFNSAVKNWNGNAATALLGDSCRLRPGSYELCVQFFTQNAPAMPLSNEVCKPFIIQETQEVKYMPPQNLTPENGKQFTEKDTRGMITFRWTPVIPKPKEAVKYILRIWEVPEGAKPQQVKTNNKPFLEKEVNNQTQVIIPGSQFKLSKRSNELIWVTEAVSAETVQGGNPKSFGKSEGSGFRISSPNVVTDNSCQCINLENHVECSGNQYVLRIDNITISNKVADGCNKKVVSWKVSSSNSTLAQSFPSPQLLNIGTTTITTNNLFFSNVTGAMVSLEYEFTFEDASTCTKPLTLELPDCNACNCVTVLNKDISCQGTVDGQPQYFFHDKISNNCPIPITSWSITSPNCDVSDFAPQSIPGANVNTGAIRITHATANPVTLVYHFNFAGGTNCTVTKALALPDCNSSCSCGQWGNIQFNVPSTTGGPTAHITATCGGNDTIKIIPNANFTISPAYTCTGNNCQVFFKYDVFYQNGTALYNNIDASVIDPQKMNTCGEVYKIVIKPSCCLTACIQCLPCTIYLKRNCPPPFCQCTTHPTVIKRTAAGGSFQEIPFDCNPAAPYINKLKCNDYDTIIVKNFCTGPCPAKSASLSIRRPDGTTFTQPVWSTAPGEVWFILPPSNQNGPYSITVTTSCGNQPCTSCKIDFQQTCLPPPCDCGSWSTVSLMTSPGTTNPVTKNCNDTFAISPNINYYFAGYICTGNPGPPTYCRGSLSYDIFKSDGTPVFTGSVNGFSGNDLNICNEVYRVVIKPTCNGKSCTPCTVYVKRTCPPSCTCGIWTDTKATYTLQGTLNTKSQVDCGKQITVDCNKPVTIYGNFQCNGQCPQEDSVFIYDPSGTLIKRGNVLPITFSPNLSTTLNPYRVVLKSTCGTLECTPCTIYVNTRCTGCDCGKWNGVKVNGKLYDCNSKSIPWKCNAPAEFSADYECAPNNETCKASISWDIKLDGRLIKRGSGSTTGAGLFTPTANGNYVVTFNPICNNKNCPPCSITLSVTDCVECSCDKFTFTGSVTAIGKTKEGKCKYAFDGTAYNPCKEIKQLSLTGSSNISFNPSSVMLNPGSNVVHFEINNLTSVTTGYIRAVIMINGKPCERRFDISLPPCDDCKCPDKRGIEIIATNISNERIGNKVLENLSKPAKAKLNGLGDIGLLGNMPGKSNARKGNTSTPVIQPGGNKWTCNNKKPIRVACHSTWELKDLFSCPGKECNKQVTYILKSDNMVISTGSLPGNITFNQPGDYSLLIIGKCGNNTCAQCEIKITVEPCDECDICSIFNYASPLLNNQGEYVSLKTGGGIECGETYYTFCNQPVLFIEYIQCGTAQNPKPGKPKIVVKNTATNQILSPDNFSYSPTGVLEATYSFSAGLYEVTVNYYPPGSKGDMPPCKTCIYYIKSMCECTCATNKITEMVYTPSGENEIPFKCNDNIHLKCDKEYTFYAGNSNTDCKMLKVYRIEGNGSIISGFGNINNIKLPEGNYLISFFTIAGSWDNIEFCDSCKINVTVTCNDCECGSWKNITTKYFFNNAEKQRDLKCGDSLDVDCNKPFKLNADYNCIGANCDKVMLYYVEGPDGTELVSGESFPVNFTPTKDGVYKIILRANCGSGACPDCIIYLKVSCPPPPCDFCKDFTEASLTQKSYAYGADNNQLNVTQSFNIPVQYKIKQVKVELVAFDWQSDNADCRKCQKNSSAFGVLNEAVLKLYGVEYEAVVPKAIFNTHELDINCLPANGVQLGSGSNIKLGISLPWQTSLSCCGDKFSFCIRYTIVTTDCKTCTIVKCYTDVPVRQHKIIDNGDGKGN